MTWMIILLIFCMFGSGYFLNSSNKTIRTIGIVLFLIGMTFCIYFGYSVGGIVGAIVGIFVMFFIGGSGLKESDKLNANEYLANKNKDYKDYKERKEQ